MESKSCRGAIPGNIVVDRLNGCFNHPFGVHLKTPSHSNPASQDETRRRLLEAAGTVFAEVGFRCATVREVCRRAGTNIAAVNYHFGGKETLYAEVLRRSQRKAFEKYPPLLDVAADAPPEEKLRAFIRSFLLRQFDEGPITQFGRMMSREMVDPTAALDGLLKERIRPMADRLRRLVAAILGCPLKDERVRLCCFSIVGQCVFFQHCRAVIPRLFPEQQLDAAAVEPLAEHITRFSLAAMRRLSDPQTLRRRRIAPVRGRG
ncbi:MAG: CerR family C-terminal domain-containing protein [Verrucomicrobiota bacterium]|nr:CerR family C-terminal domain-containing protein [Verrucomicrobiota bacterium]MDE3066968.1 CerR family C-terminal domain-containing protein [Verrucomicrobiota bacterium]